MHWEKKQKMHTKVNICREKQRWEMNQKLIIINSTSVSLHEPYLESHFQKATRVWFLGVFLGSNNINTILNGPQQNSYKALKKGLI